MTSESLRESLSALMDDEAEQLEVRRALLAGEQDPEVRRSWERYQLVRAVMHKEPWYSGVDLSSGIAAALADEPALQARPAPKRWASRMGRIAVAASVTVAVLVGVRMVNQDPAADNSMAAVERGVPAVSTSSASAPAMPAAPVGMGAILAGFSSHADQQLPVPVSEPSVWQKQRVADYLRQHAQNNMQAAPQQVPLARAASLENN